MSDEPIVCLHCATPNPGRARFCMQCGRSLVAAAAGTVAVGAGVDPLAAAASARDPRSYTPHHLVDKILTTRAALEGERKQVTVLFVDVKGSLALSEEVDPEEWHRILDRFFQVLADGIHRFEGTINQYTGDGVMALFGAPIAHEDHAQRACHAALHLTSRLRRYQRELRRERGLDFQIRLGLHSGDVIVGRIGDDLRMDYTAQGATVGIAARLQQVAEPGSAYLSSTTAELVAEYFELEDLGEFRLRNLSAPVRSYALRGPGRVRTRFDLARARGFSAFVGREQPMQALESALVDLLDGHGRVVDVAGDPGVGKSRLCFEFLERARARGLRVLECHGLPHASNVPFLPVTELLRSFFEIDDADDDRRARQKIAGAALLLDRALADELPLLFDFLGVADPAEPQPQVEGQRDQRQLFELLRRIIETDHEARPAVIFFEDLQWFDAGSRGFLEGLLELAAQVPVLLLANYRTGFQARFLPSPRHPVIHLDPLEPRHAEALLVQLLGPDPGLGGLARRIQERSQGNPLFIEEVVRSLADAGALDGATGGYRLVDRIDQIEIPFSIHSLVASRIDHLEGVEKELLQTAAVIGKQFPLAVLERVADLEGEVFSRALYGLERSEFVFEHEPYPEAVFAFTHPLVQEVALSSQLRERRARIHARVATALVHLHGNDADEHAALIAHHFEQAGNALSAARWTLRAARRIGPSATEPAMRLWRRLRELVTQAPQTPETALLGAAACRWLLFLGASHGMPEAEAEALLAEGRRFAESTRDSRSLAITIANYGAFRAQIAVEPERGLESASEALALANQSGDQRLRLKMQSRMALALVNAGRLADAADLAVPLLARAEGEAVSRFDALDQASLYWVAGDAQNYLGQIEQGMPTLERGIAFARARDLLVNAGACHNAIVRGAFFAGHSARAEEHALAAIQLAERSGNRGQVAQSQGSLCIAHQMQRRFDAAIACGEQSLTLTREHRVARLLSHAIHAWLALAYAGAGKPHDARLHAERAIQLAERRGPRYTPLAHLALARSLELDTPDDRPRIDAALRRAREAARQTGARVYDPWLEGGPKVRGLH